MKAKKIYGMNVCDIWAITFIVLVAVSRVREEGNPEVVLSFSPSLPSSLSVPSFLSISFLSFPVFVCPPLSLSHTPFYPLSPHYIPLSLSPSPLSLSAPPSLSQTPLYPLPPHYILLSLSLSLCPPLLSHKHLCTHSLPIIYYYLSLSQ